MSERKVLTIVRPKWRRGSIEPDKGFGVGRVLLLNEQGFRCCLGFDAAACGVPDAQLLGIGDPGELANQSTRLPRGYRKGRIPRGGGGYHSTAVSDAIMANDDDAIDEPTREIRVAEALKRIGWDDVVFVDGDDGPVQEGQ